MEVCFWHSIIKCKERQRKWFCFSIPGRNWIFYTSNSQSYLRNGRRLLQRQWLLWLQQQSLQSAFVLQQGQRIQSHHTLLFLSQTSDNDGPNLCIECVHLVILDPISLLDSISSILHTIPSPSSSPLISFVRAIVSRNQRSSSSVKRRWKVACL